MTETDFVVRQENPAPFFWSAGPVGVLLLHGFTGTPREMQPLGEYLHARGITVSAPLLPGHGGTLEQMNRSTWRDWVAGAEAAYATLQERCACCFVAGFSMGVLLALWIAEHDASPAGLVLYSPPLKLADWRFQLIPLIRHFVRSIPVPSVSDLHNPEAAQWMGGFERYPLVAVAELVGLRRRVVRRLARVRTPTLVVYATGDQAIHSRSGPLMVRRLARRAPVQTVVLHDSGHAVVADREWETVAEATYRFMQDHTT